MDTTLPSFCDILTAHVLYTRTHTHAHMHTHTHLGHETSQGHNIAPNICSRASTVTHMHCTLAHQRRDLQIVHSVVVFVLRVQKSGVESKQRRCFGQSLQPRKNHHLFCYVRNCFILCQNNCPSYNHATEITLKQCHL